ncbi:MAG: iron uptake porin, partial [Cyanobium sp.]
MKPFQQLLLALAGTGFCAPLAATAAEVNLTAVNQYSTEEQVTSVSQFSDVRPTDWAYQALSNLVERYGCVAGYPDGTFKGRQAMTRYEAAALLNACLDRVTEVTDELKRLMAEFEKELAVLKGRVDGLEGKVKTLEAQQFSTTTKLRGEVSFILGGTPDFNSPGPGIAEPNRTTFNYDARLSFDTSFSGKDLLRTQLRAGNFAQSGFSSTNSVTPLAQLDAAFEENCGTGTDCGDVVAINRLYYRFPIGKTFTAVIGPRVRQDEG